MKNHIMISSEPDAWGTDINGFDISAEIEKIRSAAESRGIDVYVDRECDDDQSAKIEWWDRWCHAGHNWTDAQWRDWFYFDATDEEEATA